MSGSGTDRSHKFSQIPSVSVPRSTFDRSHNLKTTFDAGYLIPILCDEALPGDTFQLNMTTYARLATPIFPVLDNMVLTSFFFAVPYRLIYDDWDKFNGAQDNPGDLAGDGEFLLPIFNQPGGTYAVGTLHDYLGLPTDIPDQVHHTLFHRAYNLIWNEWFRAEDLQDSVVVDRDEGPDTKADYVLLRRGKRHDYFTACQPFVQKGAPVSIPLGTTAPVISDTTGDGEPTFTLNSSPFKLASDVASNSAFWDGTPGASDDAAWADPKLVADLTNATAATVNELRTAFAIQKVLERDSRSGTRLTESIRAHWGVSSPDARLQRPEYLGGHQQVINITPVPQTSSTTGSKNLGDLAGYGTSIGGGHGFVQSFTEHCIILGMVQVRADLTYQQGLDRMFSRSTRFDHYLPAFATLGEQAVLNKEIYSQGSGDAAADAATFGYQERWAEYRHKPSRITGEFRSTYSLNIDEWHLAEEFLDLPVLGDAFIQDDPPVMRVIATQTEPHFLLDAFFQYKCTRPMPTYSVPGMIDRF